MEENFPKDKKVIDFFQQRDGLETLVEFHNGFQITVWNIAWGYDIGEEFAHVTSNISPTIEGA